VRTRIGSVVSFHLVGVCPAFETALWLENVVTFQPILGQPEWQFKPTNIQQPLMKN